MDEFKKLEIRFRTALAQEDPKASQDEPLIQHFLGLLAWFQEAFGDKDQEK